MKKILALVLIVGAAFFLRVHEFTTVPASLDWDEAAVGYNAYSILKTGKDEFGTVYPMAFRSFGDWKSPLYIYLTVPSIAAFGLNEMAVRLPSAIIGTLTVLGTYFLTRKLLGKEKIAVFASAMLAISPWHLQFSRVAFEPILVPFCVIWGFYFFLKSLGSPKWIYVSSTFFALSFYAYVGARFFVPLFAILIFFFFRRQVMAMKKHVIGAAILFLIVLVPLLPSITSTGGRVGGTSIFNSAEPTRMVNEYRHQDFLSNNRFSVIFHNKPLLWVEGFFLGYMRHLSPTYLFAGDNQLNWRVGSSLGILYLFEFPLILLIILKIIRTRSRVGLFLLGWALIAPIPAAFTTETPHPLRSIGAIPALSILSAWGLSELLQVFRRRSVLVYALGLLAILNIANYFHFYYNHFPYYSSFDWQYGHKEVAQIVKDNYDKYDRIVMTPKFGQPYIFMLFYLQYDPAKYQAEVAVKGDKAQKGFDKFEFRNVNILEEEKTRNSLLIASEEQLNKSDPRVKKVIYFKMPNEIAFIIADTGTKEIQQR